MNDFLKVLSRIIALILRRPLENYSFEESEDAVTKKVGDRMYTYGHKSDSDEDDTLGNVKIHTFDKEIFSGRRKKVTAGDSDFQ